MVQPPPPPPLQANPPRPPPQYPPTQATVAYVTPLTVPQNSSFAPTAPSRTMPLPNQARPPIRPLTTSSTPLQRPHPLSLAPANNVTLPLQPTQPKLAMPPRPNVVTNGSFRPISSPAPSLVASRPHAPMATAPRPTIPPIQTNHSFRVGLNQYSPLQLQPRSQPPSKPASQAPSRAGSPPAPPFSPVLPPPQPISREEGKKIAKLLKNMDPYNPPSVMARQPSTVPIAESENTDVIALRAALSVLLMQKQAAKRDIKSLNEMRREALEDPTGYVKALVERVNTPGGSDVEKAARKDKGMLDETLKFAIQGLWEKGVTGAGVKDVTEAVGSNGEANGDITMAGVNGDNEENSSSGDESGSDSEVDEKLGKKKKFGKVPNPQKVFRMPPVNWSKYQVVGEALDRLHEAERRRPSPGSPFVEIDADDEMGSSTPEEPYVMAAPYQPFHDQGRLLKKPGTSDVMSSNVGPSGDHPMQTRRAARRHAGSGP
jgi:hypothetical protein